MMPVALGCYHQRVTTQREVGYRKHNLSFELLVLKQVNVNLVLRTSFLYSL